MNIYNVFYRPANGPVALLGQTVAGSETEALLDAMEWYRLFSVFVSLAP